MTVDIISPDSVIYSGEATLVSLPGSKGAFEILQNHAAIISTLEKGRIKVTTSNDGDKFFDVNGGLVEFSDNKLNVLVN
ncbi:MAG: ATP synthase F1 subunit epsilon [Bacteroidales bacterium]|jgi:F-type H+-transporting ATPase subunit epsilon|nr:ATP synthase F1 subunit epsilon [Bacteroidales bacterium]MBQ2098081.1 ATP synthase F1 subunit epsilon [Bacteroidales bacterium]MBQ5513349.1 ATP synthase F1 subunit epsilon [Bacteroidales bacterium]MBQ5550741.1 ATP synthase F1 subunit epsilon [Bacteroidales bacterium]